MVLSLWLYLHIKSSFKSLWSVALQTSKFRFLYLMQDVEKAALASGCESDAMLFKVAYCLNFLFIILYSSHVLSPLTYYCESFQTLIENHWIVMNKTDMWLLRFYYCERWWEYKNGDIVQRNHHSKMVQKMLKALFSISVLFYFYTSTWIHSRLILSLTLRD